MYLKSRDLTAQSFGGVYRGRACICVHMGECACVLRTFALNYVILKKKMCIMKTYLMIYINTNLLS
jgi:hypothetical protein